MNLEKPKTSYNLERMEYILIKMEQGFEFVNSFITCKKLTFLEIHNWNEKQDF
jgi:hypothetical protein